MNFLMVLLGTSLLAAIPGKQVPPCGTNVLPIRMVVPKFPMDLDISYEGKAVVSLVVERKGSVSNPAIVSNAIAPEWHGGSGTIERALLEAVRQWKFRPRRHACHKNMPIVVEQSE